jgi:hypothetical protein
MRLTVLSLLAVAGFGLGVACDGGDDEPDPTSEPSATRSAATATAAAPTATAAATTSVPTAPAPTAPTPPATSGRPPPPNPAPTSTPELGADGVPIVPPLTALTFSVGPRVTIDDLTQRPMGNAGRGALNVVRVQIPSIGVEAAVEPHVVGLDGQMPEPTGADVVAWYDFSAFAGIGGLPLAGGNAVFAGDFDRVRVGPGVFFRLGEVQPGEIITLALRDGRSLYYRVEFNKVASREIDFANITFATADESATFITAAGAIAPGGYPDRRIVWARRVNCSAGGVACEVPS